MAKGVYLGEFEQIVLWAVLHLGENAYGVTIRHLLEGWTERAVSAGSIYATLERLSQKRYVSSRKGDPIPERGGKARVYFKLEEAGREALRRFERTQVAAKRGIDILAGQS